MPSLSIRSLALFAMAKLVSGAESGGTGGGSSGGGGGATGGTTTAAAAAAKALQANAAALNQDFYDYIFIVLASLIVALTFWRVGNELVKYVRQMASLNNDTQRYFAIPSAGYAKFKKHVLYAPIFSKRHNREIQLTKAINVGTLPTRFQLAFLTAYFGTNVAFCVVSIDWSQSFTTVAKEVRNRTGILAVVNMVCLPQNCRQSRVNLSDPSIHHGCPEQSLDQLAKHLFRYVQLVAQMDRKNCNLASSRSRFRMDGFRCLHFRLGSRSWGPC